MVSGSFLLHSLCTSWSSFRVFSFASLSFSVSFLVVRVASRCSVLQHTTRVNRRASVQRSVFLWIAVRCWPPEATAASCQCSARWCASVCCSATSLPRGFLDGLCGSVYPSSQSLPTQWSSLTTPAAASRGATGCTCSPSSRFVPSTCPVGLVATVSYYVR